MEYKGFTYTLTPKTAWDSLSMLEKSEMMKVAVRNGITGLKTIREKYNEFAKGGYLDWKEKANKYKHLDIDNDRTYDYEGWYNENPQRAWDFLNDNPDAHFDDKYKTVYHPTFSTQSKYSGKKDATYNPLGLVGGTWSPDYHTFTMSPDGYRGPVSMDERAWYLMNAEDNGAQLREADGSLPIFDGIPWGGVLPSVTVTGNKFSIGGDKDKNTPRPVTTGGAGYVPSMNQSAYRMVEKVGNLGKAAVKAGTKFIKGIVTQEPDAVRNAGIVYLQNLNPENRKVALDAVMHSSEGAHVMSGDAMLDTGLPNYVRAITGNPIQVNYTGSGIFDESKRDTEDGYYRPNLKRDMVNLYLKGDTTGFEDVTDNPYYQNGPDYKKYFRENYPGLSPKTYKMSSDQVPLLLYPNEYEEAINSIGKNIPVEADGWTEGGDNVGHYNRWYKMIDGKLMAIDSDVWDFNPKDWGWMGGNTDDPELVNSVGTPFILKAIRPVQQIGYNQKPISPNKKHSIGGPLVEAAMNEYKNGGGIHIAPSKKGTFTAAAKKHGKSVQAFASQVLAHPENYSPTMRKKANFVRNARHWKHGLGGNLFSGEEKGSQKMNKPNIFRRPNNSYFYQANPESEEVNLTPVNTVFDNPALWTFTDDAGRIYKPRQKPVAVQDTIAKAPNRNRLSSVIGNYIGELKYDLDNGIPVGGKYTMPAIAASALLPLAGEAFAGTSIAGIPAITWADAALTAGFGAHGLNHAINEGIEGWGDAAMTALELAPLGGLARPMWNTGKEGLQYAIKAADNTARYAFPSYDLYRTIGETTPRTTPRLHSFYTSDLTGSALNEPVYTGSPLFEFGQTIRTSPEKAYFMRAPKDVDILKLENGRFRHEVVGNEVLPSGEVNGKFVSYGEPWKEFALGENSALYEFPVGPRRGPGLMATDWKGRPQKYSVDEIYDYMQKEEALNEGFRKDVTELGLDKLKGAERVKAYRALKEEKYPELLEDYDTSIHGANQTVIPNERWNFDLFLKTPFWKYSENPLSGQVQKELMMRWPEAKYFETPTLNWTDAARTPTITTENAVRMTPAQWTSAQDAAIASGDMAEAQRLRDLHFKVSAPNTAQREKMYNASGESSFNEFNGGETGLNWFSESEKYAANHGIPRAFYINEPDIYFGNVPAWVKGTPANERYIEALKRLGYTDKQIAQKVKEINEAANSTTTTAKSIGLGDNNELVTKNNNTIKLADAVTFDDNGVRIPLGLRDNFKLNDIRYGLLPLSIGLTGYGFNE